MASFFCAFRNAAKNEYFNQSLSKWVSGKKKREKIKQMQKTEIYEGKNVDHKLNYVETSSSGTAMSS